MRIRRVSVWFAQVVRCRSCGASAETPIREKTLDHASLDHVAQALAREPIGTHFPVGWSSFWAPEGSAYACPECSGGSSNG